MSPVHLLVRETRPLVRSWSAENSSVSMRCIRLLVRRSALIPMVGVYPARGCPFNCNFCSVVKIAGRKVRSQSVETTVRTLLAAREGGVRLVMFTSDNFNKYPEARTLLQAIIDTRVGLPFFVQCDAQLSRDEEFVELLARAGCAQVFVGVESFKSHHPQSDPQISEPTRALRRSREPVP
jgi:hypothetical protein